jgi:hypothetical protein
MSTIYSYSMTECRLSGRHFFYCNWNEIVLSVGEIHFCVWCVFRCFTDLFHCLISWLESIYDYSEELTDYTSDWFINCLIQITLKLFITEESNDYICKDFKHYDFNLTFSLIPNDILFTFHFRQGFYVL